MDIAMQARCIAHLGLARTCVAVDKREDARLLSELIAVQSTGVQGSRCGRHVEGQLGIKNPCVFPKRVCGHIAGKR